MKRLLVGSILVITSSLAAAQQPGQVSGAMSSLPKPERERSMIFSSGLRGQQGVAGISFSTATVVSPHFTVGASFFIGQDNNSKSGGSLDTAQYYSDETKSKSTTLDLNATYYFKENGYRQSGWLLRGGVGHAWNEMSAGWKRYDRDPGFIIIGDGKRERERKDFSREWESTYARLGGYYQFYFGRGNSVGHILEIGLGGIVSDQSRKLYSVKSNGQNEESKFDNSSVVVDFNYGLTF